MGDAVEFRIGTASWTDPSLVNSDLFYPASIRSAEERLRFYAERFNTVEVDSTYYALPDCDRPGIAGVARRCVQRTGRGLVVDGGCAVDPVERRRRRLSLHTLD